ncbi:MAG: NUDIX domain-containing protein, partial [Anaerolineales bacterium]|nr:NUDIX domain-containing protein [Anaerolineales bacterium]
MKPGKLRAIAICVFRSEGSIFVFEGRDEEKDETFYRPLGGTIEFGEYSIDTVQRELREEIEEEIRNIRYLGMLENVFRYEGEMGHEIVIIYEADFVDPTIYEKSCCCLPPIWKNRPILRRHCHRGLREGYLRTAHCTACGRPYSE